MTIKRTGRTQLQTHSAYSRPAPGTVYARPPHTAGRRSRSRVGAALVFALLAGTVVGGAVAWPWKASGSSLIQAVVEPTALPHAVVATDPPGRFEGADGPALSGLAGAEDGFLDGSASPFDVSVAAVGRLDTDLLRAVQRAARDAAEDGVAFAITSGWRSPGYQQQLLDEAVAEYGSLEAARRFVATPETSAHVTGDAVDIGPAEADKWLSKHGSDYGLCQTYANEAWHFELATAPGGRCPKMLADASS